MAPRNSLVSAIILGAFSTASFAQTAPSAPPPQAAPAAAPTPVATRQVTVPGGTLLVVQMKSQVSSDSKAGMGFQALLMNDLMVDGVVAAKAGTSVIGKVNESKRAGRLFGKSELEISLSQLIVNGQLVPLSTSNFSEAGTTSFRKTARNSGIGAGIGAAFDGGQGAAAGAAIGGAVSLIRKGESVTIPVGAVLEFRLTQPATISVAP
ncbi:MAG: hypothetical protein K8R92_11840 [Planctomycetes bacterium]|nr:hypothetical protein [Planctomycetota bacterium]